MLKKFPVILLIFLLPGFILAFKVLPDLKSIALIKKMDYQNPELQQLREEVKGNLKKITGGTQPKIIFRRYVITPNDTFFSIMARTMLDHDTISSINRLASLWDVEPGSIWIIPNARGIAVEGDLENLARKYNINKDKILNIPGTQAFYFIPGRSLDASERSYLNGTIFMKPVRGIISSRYGVRIDPFTKKNRFHMGIDIACSDGTSVMAAAKGRVIFAGQYGGYGNLIILEHQNGYRTLYGHLGSFKAQVHQLVNQGETIALSGHTGIVTGPHLHFEVQRKGRALMPNIRETALHLQ